MKKIILHLWFSSLLVLISIILNSCQFNQSNDRTKYHETDNSAYHIIETDYFKIQTPKTWTHSFTGYSNEGDIGGAFYINNEEVNYEYGHWAPYYDQKDSYRYKIEEKTINKTKINSAINDNGETAICIFNQNNMEGQFTFYMSESVSNNYDEIMKVIAGIKFK